MPRASSQPAPERDATGGEALAASYGSLFQRLLRSRARALAAMGVEYGQGSHFGKPEAMDPVLNALRDDESRRMRALWLET